MKNYPGGPSSAGDSRPLNPSNEDGTHWRIEAETAMEIDQIDDPEILRLQNLLQGTRLQLTRALGEASELQAWSGSDEEDEGGSRGMGSLKSCDLTEEHLASLSARQRETAVKRARNREAARRSRQRKNERIKHLYKDIQSLQQENIVLLKSIEEFTKKALAGKTAQIEMRDELKVLTEASNDAQCREYDSPNVLSSPVIAHGGGLRSRAFVNMNSIAPVPALEDLHKLQAAEPAQLTARSDTLSARAAVAEHMAMLSRDNSPRDDEAEAPGAPSMPGNMRDGAIASQNRQAPMALGPNPGESFVVLPPYEGFADTEKLFGGK